MTGASGTPAVSSPAISGRTVMPHTGVSAPIAAAMRIIVGSRPVNDRAISPVAPLPTA
ncbi:MAG TPA: hypothetical protein VMN43_05115 [Aestuariivirgaceae bacterium]|nr:hypothetical protein [Aestuariivirgaceae bacterium]